MSGNKFVKISLGKKGDNIKTPKDFYDYLDAEFDFDFDPCPVNCLEDRLAFNCEWGSSNFINPPFSNIRNWIVKALHELLKGKRSVFLIPARVNTDYWHELIFPNAAEIRFVRKTIKFQGYEKGLPIPMAVVVFEPGNKEGRGTKQVNNTRDIEMRCF